MSNCSELLPDGENLRHALLWIAETMSAHPEKSKKEVVFEAECRFDLSPIECERLNQKLLAIQTASYGASS